ncbi:alpha-L-glutamate ligase [Pontibacillus halophilus JSM 076056 = DSM 19796]|uniref:Alpha-L-glutamate ligase n=1 Tax=Pontibacillus halophilus JSM 076056 = DSM 19796 TaxID=1385510 RepID=A0A0A5GK47_9BACI|nr:ATP-grasp domain-containing protein [Pontibacillus halophilus]KGX91588.1 alpha-L-glutamate ligase [Pontibacillus halophilus JSM 076056 = DSM 19796]
MNLITFQPFRTLGVPGVSYIKPDRTLLELERIKQADGVLFPERWQLPIISHGLRKKLYPSYESIILGHNKIDMTRALQAIIPSMLPYTEIKANTEGNRRMILDTFPFPFVMKENRSSMGDGVFLIKNEKDFFTYTENIGDILYVQEYIECDREARVCVVGGKVFSSYWKVSEHNAFHHNIAKGGTVSFDSVPRDLLTLVQFIVDELNINHAGFDVLYVEGKPYVLEFNVLFGNQGLLKQGKTVEQEIYDYVFHTFKPLSPSPGSFDKHIS